MKLNARTKYVINPNPNVCDPPAAGLEVAFSMNDDLIGLRCVADRRIGFILSREAALQLADLINLELKRNTYNLAS